MEVARRAGVAESVIGNAEGGRNETIRRITEVARALEVNPYWLATGEGAYDDPVEQDALPLPEQFRDLPRNEIVMAMEWLSLWRGADPLTRGLIESTFAVAGRRDQPAQRYA
jgi:transcriptional regulator with XRE-family HTH domain